MKKLPRFFSSTALLLLISLFLISCKKDLSTPDAQQESIAAGSAASMQAAVSATGCTPDALGVFVRRPDGVTRWQTLMQKWYGSDGRISNLKAYLGWDFDDYSNFFYSLEWGEVTYMGNQVYLRDVLTNKLILRATLDEEGRTVATYVHTESQGGGYPGDIDTSYYYYTGSRLDSIFNLHKFGPADASPASWAMYRFLYDAHGNVTRIYTGTEPGDFRMTFEYDYSQPIAGMAGNYQIGLPEKLVQYMDLIKYPHHHKLTKVVAGPYTPGSIYEYDTYPVARWTYASHGLDDGRVYSYVDTDSSPWVNTLYTGWNCGSAPSITTGGRERSGFTSLGAFQEKYPAPKAVQEK